MATSIAPVSQNLLEDLAAAAPAPPEPTDRGPRGSGERFNLERWIADRDLDVTGPTPWQGGRRWTLRTCPMDESHRDGAAYIVEMANGAIAAGCHHNSCQWNWHDLRDRLEPGWRDHQPSSDGGGADPPVIVNEWPAPMDAAALYGLAGDFVRAVEPHSEADPGALLLQFMVAFGNVIGRRAYFLAEADRHYMNIFVVLVGKTSKGRKGSSWGRVVRVMEHMDPEWSGSRIAAGLSSGEGLVWAVRDPIYQRKRRQREGQVVHEEEEVDAGVADKRLMVLESEFARTLRVLDRESNTLSAIIRQAWDVGDLRIMTKNSPAKATGAHISIVGHITKEELTRELSVTSAANGFGNRFLWLTVQRSKCLPEGGQINQVDFEPLVDRLRAAKECAETTGQMVRDEEAAAIWRNVYSCLSEGKPGLYGAMISRAEAQVMRLACIYALLDQSRVVRSEHLIASLAVWEYAERSVAYAFGDSLGDPDADLVLHALRSRPEGMTRTQLRDLFGRHKPATTIARALATLLEHGYVRRTQEETGGRPVERWFAVERGA